MEKSGFAVIPCLECGKLFRPVRSGQERCRHCENVPEPTEPRGAESLPPIAIPFFDQEETPVREPDPGNPCRRCGSPSPVGDRLCPVCREALRLSLSRAALEMSRKMLDQRRHRAKASLDIRPLLEEKMERAARTAISTDYLPVKRF